MPNIFQQVKGNFPGKSVFNLSYEKLFTCDMGKLIPIMCDEVVPGDVFEIGNEIVVRMQPLVAPVLHEINIVTHYFFVPYRALCKHPDVAVDFEAFITGGEDGDDATVLPLWNVTANTVGSLWDYLGFPIGVDAAGARPLNFPQVAYNWIWNEYYRDENIQDEVVVDTQEAILNACWDKDYFTSALLWQQRGTQPALPVTLTGMVPVTGKAEDIKLDTQAGSSIRTLFLQTASPYILMSAAAAATDEARWSQTALEVNAGAITATTFDISDLRLAVQIQKWMERNARAGARYIEFLRNHFGVSPNDDRLDRPEYIGGSKAPMIVSEVLQTSETATTPQGNLAGHGISVQRNYCAKIRVPEFGLIMGIMVVRPKPMYHQGIDRQWTRATRYDFYSPEFAGLSEQEILERELYCSGTEAHHLTVFGYQGRYDEMRYKRNMVCGDMHADFDHWHLCRQFGARPVLDSAFVKCTPRKDVFAAPAEDSLIVSFGNIIRAIRPLPMLATPGGL